ncbi:class I adenylate-forming enzyme family protein [Novosphingobium bradum]|uniref:Class I adenylate-forming enzyme family protein n=1 Tax=Novosphingobium bradum TaxID=1737444 RepID=A0ABV7IRK0_9SPHN
MHVYQSSFPVPAALVAPGTPYEMEIRRFRGHEQIMFRHAPTTLNALLGEAIASHRAMPDERMTELDGAVTTFARFEAQAAALCASLRGRLGIGPGDHVAVVMANRAEWMIAFFAVLAAGGVPVLVNSRGAGEEMRRAMDLVGCAAAICDGERLARLGEAGGVPCPVVLLDGTAQGALDFAAAAAPVAGLRLDFAPRQPEDAALVMFSSGTTGFPKGVVHSQGGMAHSLTLGFLANEAFDALYESQFGQSPYAGLATDRPANVLSSPLFHVAGVLPYLRSIVKGLPTILVSKWNVDQVFDILEREDVVRLGLVPTMVFDLLASPRSASGVLGKLRFFASGTAALSPAVAAALRAALPNCLMLNTYGQSETMERAASFGGLEFERNLGAVGRVMPTLAIRILTDAGEDAAPGERGEIAVYGASTMNGYINDPAATAATIRDGWVLSGDIGYFDPAGLLHVVDRKKNMVISGGENIYCAEVERVLADHPQVAEAIAFGEPDARLGEKLVAVCVVRPGATVDEQALKDHCRAHLAIYKVPRAIGFTHAPLPRNATGKVAKGVFLEGWRGGAGRAGQPQDQPQDQPMQGS